MRAAVMVVLIAVAAGCRGRAVEPLETGGAQYEAAAGDTLTLRPGDELVIGSGSARLLLRGVFDDSRCPVDVTCVWAGDAAVRLDYRRPGAATTAVELHLHSEPRAVRLDGVQVQLLDIAPQKQTDRQIRQQEYTVRLAVSDA